MVNFNCEYLLKGRIYSSNLGPLLFDSVFRALQIKQLWEYCDFFALQHEVSGDIPNRYATAPHNLDAFSCSDVLPQVPTRLNITVIIINIIILFEKVLF